MYLAALLLIGDRTYSDGNSNGKNEEKFISASNLYREMRENLGISGGLCPDIIGELGRQGLIKIEQNNGGAGIALSDKGLELYAKERGIEYVNPGKNANSNGLKDFIMPFL